MEITCTGCQKTYDLPDSRLPYGKVVTFPCPACKTKVKLDLREKNETDDLASDKIVFKPLDDSSEGSLEKEDLKKKIVKRIEDLPPMPKVMIKAREIMGRSQLQLQGYRQSHRDRSGHRRENSQGRQLGLLRSQRYGEFHSPGQRGPGIQDPRTGHYHGLLIEPAG